MYKSTFIIVSNKEIATRSYRLRLMGNCYGHIPAPGQFVDIAIPGFYLRRPISVCDADNLSITLIYKIIGGGTEALSRMKEGDTVELLLPLGHGFTPEACKDKALLVGGGLGSAPMYFLAKTLLEQGKQVSVVLGFNRSDEIVLQSEFRSLGIEPVIATMDGSAGVKGFVTDAIRQTAPEFDFFYCCGPMPMMSSLCRTLDCHGEASLEERMGCGAGFCYGCSCHTTVGTKRICKDGPVFKKEEIAW